MTGVQTCALDRKSTRLNSSHTIISYAVFCLKKKQTEREPETLPARRSLLPTDNPSRTVTSIQRPIVPPVRRRVNLPHVKSPELSVFLMIRRPQNREHDPYRRHRG